VQPQAAPARGKGMPLPAAPSPDAGTFGGINLRRRRRGEAAPPPFEPATGWSSWRSRWSSSVTSTGSSRNYTKPRFQPLSSPKG
jgi:hypothetical protein